MFAARVGMFVAQAAEYPTLYSAIGYDGRDKTTVARRVLRPIIEQYYRGLRMPLHYTADYNDPQGTRFHCCVELSVTGWYASIEDMRHTDRLTGRLSRPYWDIVDSPTVGKAKVQRALFRLLMRNDLPEQALIWTESD
jgi:hypothetical protein